MSFVADLNALVAASTNGLHACPSDWQRVPLGSVAKIINGYPFASGHFGSSGAPVIRIRDVVRGRSETNYAGPIPEGYWVEPGDLIVGMDGDFATALWRSDPALLNQRVCKIVADPAKVELRYLRYCLPGYLDLVNANTPSVTVKHLSSRTLAAIPLPLPPLATQREIVARIDALFAEVEDGEAALARARTDLGIWRKALLKAAVTGELTADWRAERMNAEGPRETGTDLLARILTERRTRWQKEPRNKGKQYGEPAGPDTDGLPDLPEGWTWAGLEQLTSRDARNGLSVKESTTQTPVRALKLDALQPDGIDWSRHRFLPVSVERAAQYLLCEGDMLVSRANGSTEFVGRCTLVTDPPVDMIFPDTAIRYPLWGDPSFHAWVRSVWSSLPTRRRLLKLAKSTAGILKISQSDIAAVALPLPPMDEIVRINAVISAASTDADAGTLYLDGIGNGSRALRQSILAAAFRGALTA